ncbi:unnamed protein product, partial [Rangifer tarandus platyrhynchus]
MLWLKCALVSHLLASGFLEYAFLLAEEQHRTPKQDTEAPARALRPALSHSAGKDRLHHEAPNQRSQQGCPAHAMGRHLVVEEAPIPVPQGLQRVLSFAACVGAGGPSARGDSERPAGREAAEGSGVESPYSRNRGFPSTQ